MRTHLVAVLVAVTLVVAVPVWAQTPPAASRYVGVGLGRLNTNFHPYYTSYVGGTPDQFNNEAHGLQVEVFAGRRQRLSDRWSLSVQGGATFNGFKWSLSIPQEPADLEYSLPYVLAASVRPELQLGSRVSIYSDVGVGAGRVHQLKTSISSSTYDFDKMQPVFTVGGGAKIEVCPRADLFVQVGQTRYRRHDLDSFTPAKVRIEHLTDAPTATGFTIGVTTRF